MQQGLLNSVVQPDSGPNTASRVLIAVATPREGEAVVRGLTGHKDPPFSLELDAEWRSIGITSRFDLVVTGVGKALAAGAVARVVDESAHAGVISAGIGGALPSIDGSSFKIGDVLVSTRCVFADEGLQTPTGFTPLADIGFDPGPGAACDAAWVEAVCPGVTGSCVMATVSTCSATDERARAVAVRTGASVEEMEGAAVATVAARLGLPMIELRAISNTTGNRDTQLWDIEAALAGISRTMSLL